MSALASLNADYSDSEDELEEGHRKKPIEEEEEEEDNENADEDDAASAGPANPALDRLKEAPSRSGSNSSRGRTPSSVSGSAKSTPTKVTRLVSYAEEGAEEDSDQERIGDDTGGGDAGDKEENEEGGDHKAAEEDGSGVVPMDLESESSQDGTAAATDEKGEKEKEEGGEGNSDAGGEDLDTSRGVEVEAWSGGITLPPEPAGLCNPRAQAFFSEQWRRKQENPNYDINVSIQASKKFRNPSIYEKLIDFCNLDEHGTNFPKELYDGHLFGKESYYDELQKVQAAEMNRREKAAEKRKNESAAASSAAASAAAAAKRRSKWDQGGPGGGGGQPGGAGSGAAAKTISAFGPLKK